MPGLAPGARAPVVIAPHGHGSAGKLAVAGCGEIPAVRDAIRRNNYDYGRQLARRGYAVVTPCFQPFGRRLDSKDAYGSDACAVTASVTATGVCPAEATPNAPLRSR